MRANKWRLYNRNYFRSGGVEFALVPPNIKPWMLVSPNGNKYAFVDHSNAIEAAPLLSGFEVK